MKNKNIQIEIEKKNTKLKALNKRLEYYMNLKNTLNNNLEDSLNEYNNLCEELKIKENEEQNILKYQEDYKKYKLLEKTKKELLIKLSQIQQEHIVIKQTYNNYIEERKNLELKEMKLKNKNETLKQTLNEIKNNISERIKEKKDLETYLDNKIKEEVT